MISDAYDPVSSPLLCPEKVYPKGDFAEACIITFSRKIIDAVLESFDCRELALIRCAAGDHPIYLTNYRGHRVAFYLSAEGSSSAGGYLEAAAWMSGAKCFLMFGSCGSLNSAATQGRFIVPTEAYRDEGLSYHYAPPSDYITVKTAAATAAAFDRLALPHVEGRVWTTDAIFRETELNVKKRQSEGCIAVEMELAGVQAVCDYLGAELYNFLVAGDVLDGPQWQGEGLDDANHEITNFHTALRLLDELLK